MRKNVSAIAIAFSLFVMLTSNSLSAADYHVKLIKKFYSMATASINGTYYPVGNSIARLISKKTKDLVVVAEPTAGSLANIEYLKSGNVDLALIQSDVAWMAFNGSHNFSENKFRELRILASLYSEVIQIVVRADSEIKTIQDLKGRKISVGEHDSGSAASVKLVLEAAGLLPEDYVLVFERFTRATESLGDGYVDAVCYAGGVPADGITRLAAKVPVRLIPVSGDVAAKLVSRYPFFSQETIAANLYKGQDSALATIGLRALLVGTEGLSSEEVLLMLGIIYDNPAVYEQGQVKIEMLLADGLKGIDNAMLHEGSRKFFRLNGQK